MSKKRPRGGASCDALAAQLRQLNGATQCDDSAHSTASAGWCGVGLTAEEVARFSRPCLVKSFGPTRQLRLCRSKALVVGVGGLGSPAATYLTTSGVGVLGLCDFDTVDASNLHRQPLYKREDVGQPKVACAVKRLSELVDASALRVHKSEGCDSLETVPGTFSIRTHESGLTRDNARDVVRDYDVVLDCTDNPRTRYLLNDACVLEGKPLVYGASVGMEGQLTVYHHNGGPCLRCIFPEPLDADACDVCSDAGVLGFVPGLIGVMQAQEAIKVLTNFGTTLSGRMLHYDAEDARQFVAKLRGRRPGCASCGDSPTDPSSLDEPTAGKASAVTASCKSAVPSTPADHRWSASRLSTALRHDSRERVVLVDVRTPNQHAMCALPESISIPYETCLADSDALKVASRSLAEAAANAATEASDHGRTLHVVCYCRRGNDSQLAVAALRPILGAHVVDLEGGLNAWRRDVDNTFPLY
ncbi:adenylyltransferase and sulfurtransferase MOCS3 [Pycnococcus provasolii]